jgi:hypothetical protein
MIVPSVPWRSCFEALFEETFSIVGARFLVGGKGHYLNSSAELGGGVIELLRGHPIDT